MDCIWHEYNPVPTANQLSNLFFRVVQIAASVQSRIADEQQPSDTVNPCHCSSNASNQRLVQPFDQIHSSLQQFIIRQILLRPTIQYLVQSQSLSPTEFLVTEIGVMNDLCDTL